MEAIISAETFTVEDDVHFMFTTGSRHIDWFVVVRFVGGRGTAVSGRETSAGRSGIAAPPGVMYSVTAEGVYSRFL
jgi:hypothetical protein